MFEEQLEKTFNCNNETFHLNENSKYPIHKIKDMLIEMSIEKKKPIVIRSI